MNIEELSKIEDPEEYFQKIREQLMCYTKHPQKTPRIPPISNDI